MTEKPKLFCFGLGYSAAVLSRRLLGHGWRIAGTSRDPAKRAGLAAEGFEMHAFSEEAPLADAGTALAGTTHLLISIAPGAQGDPVLLNHLADLRALSALRWVGYLSTTGVYGNRDGGWVDEQSELRATSPRGRRRIAAERAWLSQVGDAVPVHIFRLAGIYGPGRSVLDQVRAGTARRVDKGGHLFSRIHVEDIATVLERSMKRPKPGAVYNLCDDEPAPSADVVLEACRLLGVAPPPAVPFEQAWAEMSPMARSFWSDSRRVRNGRIAAELGVRLRYPTYREGLAAILAEGG
ncbi:MAG: SDR family oxidoreductase [Acetobacterales bacterium]